MDEMVRYIFGSMKGYNRNFKLIRNFMQTQQRINRLTVVALASLLFGYLSNTKDVSELSRRIQELENTTEQNKGE